MNFEAFLLRTQQEIPISLTISSKNQTYFEEYSIVVELEGQKMEFKSPNLFNCFHDFLSHVITTYQDASIKLKISFDIYFESRFKSKSKARELISNHHLLISLICSSVVDRYFEDEHDFEMFGEAVFEDRRIILEGPDIEQLFEQLYYGLKDIEEIRICLYCKHYGRIPGTKIHPMYSSSVCWQPKSNIHEFYKDSSTLLDKIFEKIIPDLLLKEEKRGNLEEEKEIADAVNDINTIIQSDKKKKEKLIDCETIIQNITELKRRLPIENCNLWEKRSR